MLGSRLVDKSSGIVMVHFFGLFRDLLVVQAIVTPVVETTECHYKGLNTLVEAKEKAGF